MLRSEKIGPAPIVVDGIPVLPTPLPAGCIRHRSTRAPYPRGQQKFLRDRDGNICRVCGDWEEIMRTEFWETGIVYVYDPQYHPPLETHHVVAHALGGCSHPHNLITLCRRCNRDLGVTTGGEFGVAA